MTALKHESETPMNGSMPLGSSSTADLIRELGFDKHVRLAVITGDSEAQVSLLQAARTSDLFDYDVTCFADFASGVAALESERYHLALVSDLVGNATALDVVRQARALAIDTPIVVITGPAQRRVDIEVLRDGGADVVEKDDIVRPSVLERIIRHTLLRSQQARELVRRASYDDLTGLANRTYFRSKLEQYLSTAGRDDGEVSVVYIDLDGFKAINDRYGHATGDSVLQAVANRMSDSVADRGLVARLGGDEFAVVVTGGDDAAKQVERRVVRALQQDFFHAGRQVKVRASVGAATFPRDGATADQLVDTADRMMYGAKQRRASVQGESKPEGRWWRRLQRLVEDFPRALENDELHLVFQPQLDDLGGNVRSIEALTRWEHPSLGTVSPAEFIPAIERCGLSYELDSWVFRRALQARREWSRSGMQVPRMAINVSAKSLVKPSLLYMVKDGLDATGQSPSDVEIELTETAVLDSKAAPVMKELRDSGIALAIDDFGVGHSSLASLAQTPATVLKLDRTLLVGASLNDRHEKVLRWAIRLGRDLGMEVVAEGIEAESQLDLLRQESVDGYQGFFLARPLKADDLMRWFKTSVRTDDSTPPADPDAASIRAALGPSRPPSALSSSPC